MERLLTGGDLRPGFASKEERDSDCWAETQQDEPFYAKMETLGYRVYVQYFCGLGVGTAFVQGRRAAVTSHDEAS